MQAWGKLGRLWLTSQSSWGVIAARQYPALAAKSRPFFPILPTGAEAEPEHGFSTAHGSVWSLHVLMALLTGFLLP